MESMRGDGTGVCGLLSEKDVTSRQTIHFTHDILMAAQ